MLDGLKEIVRRVEAVKSYSGLGVQFLATLGYSGATDASGKETIHLLKVFYMNLSEGNVEVILVYLPI
jgi:hypothetical protein